VEDQTGLRILNFRDEECISMPNEAQSSLSGLEFHVLCFKTRALKART
jgi:hypothetical protein